MIPSIVSMALFGATIAATPTAQDLERGAIKQRRGIRDGQMELEVRRWNPSSSDSPSAPAVYKYSITFLGEMVRIDYDLATESGKIIAGDGRYVWHSADITPNGRKFDIMRGDLSGFSLRHIVFDPRLVGAYPATIGALHSGALEKVLLRADRIHSAVQEAHIDGRRLWRVETKLKDGLQLTLMFDPERGGSIVHAESERRYPDGLLIDSMTSTLRRYGDIWFPTKVEAKRTVDGREVEREVVLVTKAVFNVGVDSTRLTLSGLDVPPGTGAFEQPPHSAGGRMWDGEKLVLLGARTEDAPQVSDIRWLVLFVNSIILLAMLIWWLGRRRKRMGISAVC